MLADDFDITVDQLQKWTSRIGSDCDTGLYANLVDGSERAVCVAVNGSSPTSTATASMGPTQTSIVFGCKQHYTVQSGDSCAAIDAQFAITFAQL